MRSLQKNGKSIDKQMTHFSTTFTVNESPVEVFAAVKNVSAWWTENLTGQSEKVGDAFTVQFGDVHYSRQQVIDLIPNQKLVWLVTESRLNFVKNTAEWDQTRILFEVSSVDSKTQLRFTHEGLTPPQECYDACSGAWTEYIQDSLLALITRGQGNPARKS